MSNDAVSVDESGKPVPESGSVVSRWKFLKEVNLMLRRTLSVRGAWMAAIGTAILAATTLVSVHAEKRIGLEKRVLAQSRGNNQGNAVAQFSCSQNNGNNTCTVVGNDCAVCTVATYLFPIGKPIGYKLGGIFSCGNNKSGTCDANLLCDTTNGNIIGTCQNPSGVVVQ